MDLLIRILFLFIFLYSDLLASDTILVEINKTMHKLPLLREEIYQVVYDPNTNLIWLDNEMVRENKKNYFDAYDYCESLVYLNKKDWKLPYIKELYEIYDKNKIPHVNSAFKNLGYVKEKYAYLCDESKYWSRTGYYERGFSWRYVISFSENCNDPFQEVIIDSLYSSNNDELFHFTCVREKMHKFDISFNSLVSYFIKVQILHIKKPEKQKIKKDEFETTKMFLNRLHKQQQDYDKKLYIYNQIIKSKKKFFVKNAYKMAIEYLWGKPIIDKLKYNADKEEFSFLLLFEKNKKFKKYLIFKMPLKTAKDFKKNFKRFDKYALFNIECKNKDCKFILKDIVIYQKNNRKIIIKIY